MINRKAFLTNAIEEGFKNDVSGYPLVLKHSKGRKLIDYKIYGNSIQSGTPTPDNPVEIESVGDRTVNLIDYHNLSSTTNKGITYTNNNDGSFTANGTLIDTLSIYSFEVPSLEKGVTYYTSCGQDLNEKNRRYYLFLMIKNTSTNTVRYHSSSVVNKTFILAENEEVTALEIRINDSTASSITVDNVIFKPIVCKNEEYKEYEPYGYKIPVTVSGKNMFNRNAIFSSVLSGGYLEVTDTGYNILKTTAFSNGMSIGNFKDLVPNLKVGDKFKISFETNAIRNNQNVNYIYLNVYKSILRIGNKYTCTQEMLNSSMYIYSSGTEDCYYKNIMVYKSTETSDFEPYQEPVTTNIYLNEPLRKVGEYADYIDFKNKKVVRNVGTMEHTSNTTVSKGTNATEGGVYRNYIFPSPMMKFGINMDGLCTTLSTKKKEWASLIAPSVRFGQSNNVIYIMTPMQIVTNQDLYNYVTNNGKNKCIYYYQLPNFTEETIELPNIPTLKYTNTITTDTTVEASNMNVSYKSFEKE